MPRRRNGTDPLILIAGLAITDLVALKGYLGDAMRKYAVQVTQLFWMTRCAVKNPPPLDQFIQQNPNFETQMWWWKAERILRGESPFDWDAFRRHLMAINAPDPGTVPPKEFC